MGNLWIKKKYLDLILSSKKTVEVRILYPSLRSLKKGEKIKLNNRYLATVKDVRIYRNFKNLLSSEDPEKIIPGKSKNEVLKVLRKLYLPEKEKLGVIAIELKI